MGITADAKVHSENDLVKWTKFLLVQPWNVVIIWTKKYLFDPSKSIRWFYQTNLTKQTGNLMNSTKNSIKTLCTRPNYSLKTTKRFRWIEFFFRVYILDSLCSFSYACQQQCIFQRFPFQASRVVHHRQYGYSPCDFINKQRQISSWNNPTWKTTSNSCSHHSISRLRTSRYGTSHLGWVTDLSSYTMLLVSSIPWWYR